MTYSEAAVLVLDSGSMAVQTPARTSVRRIFILSQYEMSGVLGQCLCRSGGAGDQGYIYTSPGSRHHRSQSETEIVTQADRQTHR